MDRMLLEVPLEVPTERLIVRCYRAGDGPSLHAAGIRNRAHLARYASSEMILGATTEELGEILGRTLHARWISREVFVAGAFLVGTGEFVGQVTLSPLDWTAPTFEVTFFVDVLHGGNGYVTEAVRAMLGLAFYRLQAHRVTLRTDETNTPSHHVAKRCGFTLEGHLRQTRRNPDGTFTGDSVHGLLRPEFEKLLAS